MPINLSSHALEYQMTFCKPVIKRYDITLSRLCAELNLAQTCDSEALLDHWFPWDFVCSSCLHWHATYSSWMCLKEFQLAINMHYQCGQSSAGILATQFGFCRVGVHRWVPTCALWLQGDVIWTAHMTISSEAAFCATLSWWMFTSLN